MIIPLECDYLICAEVKKEGNPGERVDDRRDPGGSGQVHARLRIVKIETVESSENVRLQGQPYRIALKSETDVSYGKQP